MTDHSNKRSAHSSDNDDDDEEGKYMISSFRRSRPRRRLTHQNEASNDSYIDLFADDDGSDNVSASCRKEVDSGHIESGIEMSGQDGDGNYHEILESVPMSADEEGHDQESMSNFTGTYDDDDQEQISTGNENENDPMWFEEEIGLNEAILESLNAKVLAINEQILNQRYVSYHFNLYRDEYNTFS